MAGLKIRVERLPESKRPPELTEVFPKVCYWCDWHSTSYGKCEKFDIEFIDEWDNDESHSHRCADWKSYWIKESEAEDG